MSYAETYAAWVRDPEGWWLNEARAIDWDRFPSRALSDEKAPIYEWFADGLVNTCWNAVDRHVAAGRGGQLAIIHDSPVTNSVQRVTFAELQQRVARLAGALRAHGIEKGDRVIIYMPMVPEALEAAILGQTKGSVHSVQPGAVTMTDVTELGTLLTPARIAPLAEVARRHGLPVHLDGARFANAVAASGATPAELTWKSGVDALSFGGTKGGLMGAEAVIFFDPEKSWEFQLRRKRGGHLFSKGRYLAAQFEGWLQDGLWLQLARHANQMCARLATGLAAVPGVKLAHPVEANIAFALLPEAVHARLQAAGITYYSQDGGLARLVTSWATTEAEVDQLLALARG